MSTGDDLSDEAINPRLRGRKPKNDDILSPGVWILHPETKVVHLVTHRYQRDRLLVEGGKIVEQPAQESAVHATAEAESEEALRAEIARLQAKLNKREDVTNGSTSNDEPDHHPRETADQRPERAKSAVHR